MQLIVSAYAGLVQLPEPRLNQKGDPIDPCCVRFDAAPRYPQRADALNLGPIYQYHNAFAFSSGTYVMHDIFRERLAEIADYPAISIGASRVNHTNGAIAASGGLFKELIDFSITSGTIGPTTCAKLADDFRLFIGAIDVQHDELFAELYRNWFFAFSLAANNGAVQLS
ncbi:hypothetical protein [Burkholderia gladioli]|uniref:Uncharacterized protein n=1 Tax=Burkholderia gladioli (strain BSR3) TaxID=999541 RepID=F2LRY9_BURGS|nr:hypothetical protein [Burkholderia gladioli]AEA65444.1 hypothetical protein bgla_1p0390 [Burkholderia gladioli BSR3]MBW5288191.1 hypothetical protein [Burkholderia gladioli]